MPSYRMPGFDELYDRYLAAAQSAGPGGDGGRQVWQVPDTPEPSNGPGYGTGEDAVLTMQLCEDESPRTGPAPSDQAR